MDKYIELKDIYKKKDYVGKRLNIIIDEEIKLNNADIVVHKVSDSIDIYIKKDDQTKNVINILEKYKNMRFPLSIEYIVPVRDLLFQRIIMAC